MTEARRVIVSPHAVLRLRERVGVATRDPIAHIFFEVQEAFRAGRTSRRIPRWAVAEGRDRMRKKTREHAVKYAWNAAETACYVLVWAAAHGDGKRSWIVVTTLAAAEVAAA